jgi:hypothetical protein
VNTTSLGGDGGFFPPKDAEFGNESVADGAGVESLVAVGFAVPLGSVGSAADDDRGRSVAGDGAADLLTLEGAAQPSATVIVNAAPAHRVRAQRPAAMANTVVVNGSIPCRRRRLSEQCMIDSQNRGADQHKRERSRSVHDRLRRWGGARGQVAPMEMNSRTTEPLG